MNMALSQRWCQPSNNSQIITLDNFDKESVVWILAYLFTLELHSLPFEATFDFRMF